MSLYPLTTSAGEPHLWIAAVADKCVSTTALCSCAGTQRPPSCHHMSDISLFRQPYCNKTLTKGKTGASIQSHIILITCLGQGFTRLNEAARERWLMWCFTWLLLQVMVTSANTPLPCDHLNTRKCTFLEDYCDMNGAFVPFASWPWWQKGEWALLWLTEVVTSCLRVLTDLFPGLPLNGTWNCPDCFPTKERLQVVLFYHTG